MPTFKDRQSEIDGRLISRREEEEQRHVRKSVLRLPLILVILVIGALGAGVSAVWKTEGVWAAACAGLLVGITGQLLQQTMDFSLWVDPAWYTFALMIALLGTAPFLAQATTNPQVGEEAKVFQAAALGPIEDSTDL